MNRSQSGSWQHRCSGAGLQNNVGKTWRPIIWKRMTDNPANEVFVNAAECSAKTAEKDKTRKSSQKSKESRKKSKYSKSDNSVAARKAYSKHDGEIEPDDNVQDISPEYLDKLKTSFYDTQVAITIEEREGIERKTRQQSGCTLRKEKRITASHVGGISKMKKSTKRSNKVEELLYSTFRGFKATMYGILREDAAKEKYVAEQQANHPGLNTKPSGLVVSLLLKTHGRQPALMVSF